MREKLVKQGPKQVLKKRIRMHIPRDIIPAQGASIREWHERAHTCAHAGTHTYSLTPRPADLCSQRLCR